MLLDLDLFLSLSQMLRKRTEMSQNNQPNKEIDHPYQRLQVTLTSLIANTPSGEKLASEPELARQLGVSRATLREAMRTFEGQGLIRRRQGIGTFVVGHPKVIKTGLEALESIETIAKRDQMDVAMGDLHIRKINAVAEVAQALQVSVETPLIEVSRVIYAENRPASYLIDILPEDTLTDADLREGFTGSVLDLLLRRGAPALRNSFTEIQAVAASSEISKALQIQRGDVLLKFVAQLYAADGRILDYSLSYFLPGIFSFHVVRSVGVERPGMLAPDSGGV
jgi:GntR family transcriptional regulator